MNPRTDAARDPSDADPPLLDVVGWTLPCVQEITGAGTGPWVPEGRPDRFRRFAAGPPAARVVVDADGWLLAEGRLAARFARIRGRRMDIATAMIYPTADPGRLPVLACEWVCIGPRCHALVLDVEWVVDPEPEAVARLDAALDGPAARWMERFPDRGDAPQWFEEIRSRHGIFSSCALDELDDARRAWSDYTAALAETLYRPDWLAACAAGPDHPAVAEYKRHHDHASPGRKVMAPRFGAEFTDAFLGLWHFGPAGGPPASDAD